MPVWLEEIFDSIQRTFSTMTFVDFVDIACVTVVLYFAYKFVRDRRAGKLALGVLLIIAILAVTKIADLHTMQFIFSNFLQVGLVALVVVFQPELRSLLEKVGGSSINGIRSFSGSKDQDEMSDAIDEVCRAVADMSATRTGALIAFERTTKIGEYSATGTVIDASVNAMLIKNLFYNKAPLHDGALIVKKDRIYAAGCVLPLTTQDTISRDLGTRHRAAVGLTENSDALVVVVSEETGTVSYAYEGKLISGCNDQTLREVMREKLIPHSVKAVIRAKSRLSKNKNVKVREKPDGGFSK